MAELVSVPAGAALANFNPWIPVFGAAIFMVLGILFAYVVVPDVRPAGSKSEGGSDGDFLSSAQESHPTWLMSIHHRWRKIVDEFRKDSSWIRDVNVLLIMASFFVCQLGRMISGITLQYAAAKFHWKFDKVRLRRSGNKVVNNADHLIQGILTSFSAGWSQSIRSSGHHSRPFVHPGETLQAQRRGERQTNHPDQRRLPHHRIFCDVPRCFTRHSGLWADGLRPGICLFRHGQEFPHGHGGPNAHWNCLHRSHDDVVRRSGDW